MSDRSREEPPAPSELAIALEIEPDAEAQFDIGVDYAARLAGAVLAGGAPGLHLYTFNRHEAVLAVLERLGIRTPAQLTTERNTRQR